MSRGRFITFEGGEGAGKTTQAERLARHLSARGLATRITREPGGTPFAERLRDVLMAPSEPAPDPLAQALTFYAARADHLAQVIVPALRAGTWVLCDRFADSTRAYQGAAGGVNREYLSRLERMVVGTSRPDLTIVLDLDPAEGLARASRRQGQGDAERDAFEGRELAFHTRLRAAFLAIAKAEPERCVVVAGGQPADAVEAEVWEHVRDRLLPGDRTAAGASKGSGS